VKIGLASRRGVCLGSAVAILFIAGCAYPTRATGPNDAQTPQWRGRLSLKIDTAPPQAFFSAFELRGNAQQGELILLSPLGTALATLNWSAQRASLQTGSERREFDNLDAMLQSTLGAPLPVDSLFAWLAGEPKDAPGWQADLSQWGQARLTATRLNPLPTAQLRIVLDN
jgi:outer membrane lipoprotein LolB